MSLRSRLLIVTLTGLAVTMALWGWVQVRALDRILVEQQAKRISAVAETVGTYYLHFPSGRGLTALDTTLKENLQLDPRLARIDIFSVTAVDVDTLAGASRVHDEWPDATVYAAAQTRKPQTMKIRTEAGPAVGLLYPLTPEKGSRARIWVGVIIFSQFTAEILARAQKLMVVSSLGLLIVVFLVLAVSYGWLIGRPLQAIIHAIDEFERGTYTKRIPIRTTDEWGQLAAHFNAMADEIAGVLDREEELNRHLKDRVQEATRQVVQLQNQVNELQRLTALGYLTATMAHDLGTPLHSIGGLASLLLEQQAWPPDIQRKLELIVQETQRLQTIIRNVRRATRPPDPHLESVGVSDMLNATLPLVDPLIRKAGIDLKVDIAPDLPRLHLDRHRVQTALLNLIQNALEAMDGPGEIRIAAAAAPDRNAVALSVRDTGPGIPAEIQERVFEPFFSTRRDEALHGLGLAIVRDIVKFHGGDIEIRSEPGRGANITLYFPLSGAGPGAAA
jgi:signal transduction histidine kinase